MTEAVAPSDRGWVVSIQEPGVKKPLGTGVVIDGQRVLTCRHVLGERSEGQLSVVCPLAEDPFVPPLRVARVIRATHDEADVALLTLADSLPAGVNPAPLKRPKSTALVGHTWWAYGFSDGIGNDASGAIGQALTTAWVRLDSDSRYLIEPGFSGGPLWSTAYSAVVGLVGQKHGSGDGRCFTLHAAAMALPDEKLGDLIDAWELRDSGADAALSWGWTLGEDVEGRRHWRPR